MPPPYRRRHPLIHLAVRSTWRAASALHRWCFAPAFDSVKGEVNWGEWARALAVAILPALLSGTSVWGLLAAGLGATTSDASNIFLAPWLASLATGLSVAAASRNHRLHDGRDTNPNARR